MPPRTKKSPDTAVGTSTPAASNNSSSNPPPMLPDAAIRSFATLKSNSPGSHYKTLVPLTTGSHNIFINIPKLKGQGKHICPLGLNNEGQLVPVPLPQSSEDGQQSQPSEIEPAIFTFVNCEQPEGSSGSDGSYLKILINGQPLMSVGNQIKCTNNGTSASDSAQKWLVKQKNGDCNQYSIACHLEKSDNEDEPETNKWKWIAWKDGDEKDQKTSYLGLGENKKPRCKPKGFKNPQSIKEYMIIKPVDLPITSGNHNIFYADKNNMLRAIGLDAGSKLLKVLPHDAAPSQYANFSFKWEENTEHSSGTYMNIYIDGNPIYSEVSNNGYIELIKCTSNGNLGAWEVLQRDTNIYSFFDNDQYYSDTTQYFASDRHTWIAEPSDNPDETSYIKLYKRHDFPSKHELWFVQPAIAYK